MPFNAYIRARARTYPTPILRQGDTCICRRGRVEIICSAGDDAHTTHNGGVRERRAFAAFPLIFIPFRLCLLACPPVVGLPWYTHADSVACTPAQATYRIQISVGHTFVCWWSVAHMMSDVRKREGGRGRRLEAHTAALGTSHGNWLGYF